MREPFIFSKPFHVSMCVIAIIWGLMLHDPLLLVAGTLMAGLLLLQELVDQ